MIHHPTLRRLHFSDNTRLLMLALIVGLATGICVRLYRVGITFFHDILQVQLGQNTLGHWLAAIGIDPRLSIIIVLALTGAVVGWLMGRFVGHEKYHGVPGIMASVALTGGRLPYWKMPVKALASMLSLGGGASTGPEDPSVQIGSNLGSFFGQKLHLDEERVRLLVAAGAASAVAAAFNAPIAGVFFALELILGEFTTRSFGIVVLSAVISSGFTRGLIGANPVFEGLELHLGTPWQLPFYALLGIVLAVFSVVAIRFLQWQSEIWHRYAAHIHPVIKTSVTGACVGIIGVFLPPILGVGEEFMHAVLTGHAEIGIVVLVLLAFAKLIATAISINGGFVGGIFAPTLFMGIVLGSAWGQSLLAIFPEATVGAAPAYAIAGMAGLMAGILRAPITAIMIVFEITDDYALILPMMLTAVICTFLVEQFGTTGIYTLSLLKHGIHLTQGRDVDVMQGVSVGDVMQTPVPTLAETAHLRDLRDAFREHHTRALCIVNQNNTLCGIVTLGDLQRHFELAAQTEENLENLTVSDICKRDVITIQPDEPVFNAVRLMGSRDIGRLPVIKDGQLIGILRRQHIMQAYNVAISRKLHAQHTAEQIRLHTLTGAHVLEYYIPTTAAICYQRIADITFPPEAIIAAIRRKDRLVVPHGTTQILPGDTVTLVADPDAEILLNQLFGKSN
jgi:CIC family chloride channel protein